MNEDSKRTKYALDNNNTKKVIGSLAWRGTHVVLGIDGF